MLPFNGKYVMQLRGINGEKVYHSETFDCWVKYSIDPSQAYDPLPSEFYQMEQEIEDTINDLKDGKIPIGMAERAKIAESILWWDL